MDKTLEQVRDVFHKLRRELEVTSYHIGKDRLFQLVDAGINALASNPVEQTADTQAIRKAALEEEEKNIRRYDADGMLCLEGEFVKYDDCIALLSQFTFAPPSPADADRDRVDALRYRWLLEMPSHIRDLKYKGKHAAFYMNWNGTAEELSAAIDAARAAQEKQSG